MSVRILQTVSILWLFVFALLIHGKAFGQDIEHAPTVAQCQADQRLWLSQMEPEHQTLPIWSAMAERIAEMDSCGKVDPDHSKEYENTCHELEFNLADRFMDFIKRNGMWGQFTAQDKAGKR